MFKKGFTLIEMIAVLAILAISALIGAPPLMDYIREAEQQARTETAQTLYLTAQNQLTQLRALGNLKSAYGGSIAGRYFETDADGNFTDKLDTSLTGTNNVHDALGTNYPTADLENGQDDYVRYLSKPAGFDVSMMSDPLYQLLAPAIRDHSIMHGAILLEYNILTGKVLSVFYSDLDSVSEFTYTADGSFSSIQGERGEPYDDIAEQRLQGYYGVDYTGDHPPDRSYQMSIHMYDGYDDGLPDSYDVEHSTGLFRYNRPLVDVGDPTLSQSLENALYVEIFIEKVAFTSASTPLFDITVGGSALLNDYDLSGFAENESFEDALANFDARGEILIYRNDTPNGYIVDGDFARFILVLDYVGGDLSSENAERDKYSITSVLDLNGAVLPLDPNTNINATIVEEGGIFPAISSNYKNPFFSTEYDSNNLPDEVDFENSIATARHLNNIRYVADNSTHTFYQIEDIDLASEDGIINSTTVDEDFADAFGDWNLILSPLPTLNGKYTGEYTDPDGEIAMLSLQNLNVFNVNLDTIDTAGIAGHSVGLFEIIGETGEFSHVMFINPVVEVKNAGGMNADVGKYAGVVTGFSEGLIHHVTVSSNSATSPVIDDDNNDPSNLFNDYVGGVVGMVGDSVGENTIHHILYLAVAPSEISGSSSSNRIRYDFPIIGSNLQIGAYDNTSTGDLALTKTNADFALTDKAIHDESCYFMIGEARHVDNDSVDTTPFNINVDTITNGHGNGISTGDLYREMNDNTSDFYQNFMQSLDKSTVEYSYTARVANPLLVGTWNKDNYPYPYFGTLYPDNNDIDPTTEIFDFTWPVVELKSFEAEFVYYEIYGDTTTREISIKYYQIDDAGNEITPTANQLINDMGDNLRILNDGYAIRVNRPYSMLESEDITLTVEGNTISNPVGTWLHRPNENPQYDDYTSWFRETASSTHIESILTINNGYFQPQADVSSTDNDILNITLSNGAQSASAYINPLYAKAIYPNNTAPSQYLVRSVRHLNNIGRYENSTSHVSNFIQELDFDLGNYYGLSTGFNANPNNWFYTSVLGDRVYRAAKYSSGYIGSSGLDVNYGTTNNQIHVVASTGVDFAGTYDGNNKTISNLQLSSGTSDVALFHATTETATIKNVNIVNFNIISNGIADSGTLVASNYGKIEDITVTGSTMYGGANEYGNRAVSIGGVVGFNYHTGVLDNVTIYNSVINSIQMGSGGTYDPAVIGAGGIVGLNSGTLQNSGAINTTVSVRNSFAGGLVGAVVSTNDKTDGGVVKDNYFIYDGVDALGNPIAPVNYNYDNTTALAGNFHIYSIGGIVGGGADLTNSTVAAVSNGTISDNLYLAIAPTVDIDITTGEPTGGGAPTQYPIVGEPTSFELIVDPGAGLGIGANNFTEVNNNIFLSGARYSDDNVNWIDYAYNTGTFYDPDAANLFDVVGMASEFINRTWLSTYGNNQLETWQNTTPYPTPVGESVVNDVPYATNRAKQYTDFDGTGSVDTDAYSARMLFGGQTIGYTAAGESVVTALEITNKSTSDALPLDGSEISVDLGNYADYIDGSVFEIIDPATEPTAVIKLVAQDGTELTPSVPYTFDSTANTITIDTTALPDIATDETVRFEFELPVTTEFTPATFTSPISTYYYYIAMQASLTLDSEPETVLTSDKLHIQPFTITTSYNDGNQVANGDTITAKTVFTVNADPTHTHLGVLTEIIPGQFTIDVTSVTMDGTALVAGNDFSLDTDPVTGDHELVIKNVGLTADSTVTIEYQLTHGGIGGELTAMTMFNKTAYLDGRAVAYNLLSLQTDISVEELPPAPAPAPAPTPTPAPSPEPSPELEPEPDEPITP